MTITPEDDTPDEHSPGANDHDPAAVIPEWAPVEPLPSSEMLLATFAGTQSVTIIDILHPAFDLVACQREYRVAFDVLESGTESVALLTRAVAELVSAQADIEMLIDIIDEAVEKRLLQHCKGWKRPTSTEPEHFTTMPMVVVHTETIGQIIARMAELWEMVSASSDALRDLPEANRLAELCDGYDTLAAEIEAGRRVPPGL
ncbi:hypothetical protein V7968_16365 [Nocardia vulneris]|uniref:hypothetical protein n=1 Tax=Nocardia vulneris TaxID=1141657 RepID=UPI0030D43894